MVFFKFGFMLMSAPSTVALRTYRMSAYFYNNKHYKYCENTCNVSFFSFHAFPERYIKNTTGGRAVYVIIHWSAVAAPKLTRIYLFTHSCFTQYNIKKSGSKNSRCI